ncbi:MAG: cytochrome C [Gammaproteobacteria bacterium]|nr:MAG: cytochrome C [Gammaproteobacteria bacterium]
MARKLTWATGLVIFVAGIVFAGLFNMGLAYTNRMEFCTSCHSMQVNLREYKETVHYKNASGVRATCHDCHVPHDFIPLMKAKILAAKDVWGEITGKIGTQEKYEAHRWEMANAVWKKMKASNSATCRSCHSFEAMAFDEQGRSARKRHSRAEERGETCIDCHTGIAHEEPEEPEDAEDAEEEGEG